MPAPRYSNATDLPQGQDTFIARWDINNIPAGCNKEKLKIKMDMHGLLSVVGAQALEETKEEVPDAPSADAAAAAGMEVEKVHVPTKYLLLLTYRFFLFLCARRFFFFFSRHSLPRFHFFLTLYIDSRLSSHSHLGPGDRPHRSST